MQQNDDGMNSAHLKGKNPNSKTTQVHLLIANVALTFFCELARYDLQTYMLFQQLL